VDEQLETKLSINSRTYQYNVYGFTALQSVTIADPAVQEVWVAEGVIPVKALPAAE
jgi:hypothetical protein